jgi:hypothetical protein
MTKKCSLFFNRELDKTVKDNDYPTFEPFPFITMRHSGYLNGGSYVEQGQVMKLIKIKQEDKTMYIYQGLRKMDRAEFGFTNFSDKDIVEKGIYGAEQFLRIKSDWFTKSSSKEVGILNKVICKN